MKNAMFLLIALLLTTPCLSLGDAPVKSSTLTLKGFYLKSTSVEYTVYEVCDNGFLSEIHQDKSFKAYKLDLEINHSYAIIFTKNDVSKTLYITPLEAGIFELDVDFQNDLSANLVYDPEKHTYIVKIIHDNEEGEETHQYTSK